MWIKVLDNQFNNNPVKVLIFLYDTTEENKEVVRIQSFFDYLYLIEDVVLESRMSAFDFISTYNDEMADRFLRRQANEVGLFMDPTTFLKP